MKKNRLRLVIIAVVIVLVVLFKIFHKAILR